MFNHKDRLIVINDAIPCGVTRRGDDFCKGHFHFYLEPQNSSKSIYLFSTRRYYPSVDRFIQREGVKVAKQTYSITLGQFYGRRHCYNHNPVLSKLLNYHIPKWLKYVAEFELDKAVVEIPIPERSKNPDRCMAPHWEERAA